MNPSRTIAALAGTLSLVLTCAWPGYAQPPAGTPPAATAAPAPAAAPAAPGKKPATSAAARAEALQIAHDKLERADDASVQQGLASLATLGGEPAAQLVIARVRRGLPPQLYEAAIDTLVLLGRPSAATALLELALHARAAIRERALAALGALHVRSAQSALLFALDDPSPQVRVAAVSALGAVGDTRALPALYVAADRGIDGALEAAGKILRPNDLKGLLARARDADVSAIKPALSAIMARKDFPSEGKLHIVQELSKLASPSARTLLVTWLDAYKVAGPANLRKALFDGIKHIDDLDKAKEEVTVTPAAGGKS